MKKTKFFSAVLTAAVIFILFAAATVPAVTAEDISATKTNANLIVLTPGHSRTIFYELHDSISNDITALHGTLLMTLGAGTLTVSVSASAGEGAEILYATTGFIGVTPVLEYAYGSAALSMNIPVAEFSAGLLLTGIVAGVGSPDFPVDVSMVFYLSP